MYIDLNRRFRELVPDTAAGTTDRTTLTPSIKSLDWSGLLALPRVVVLSEAGAGKTEEIRQATLRLRQQGKPAFFLRLEHIATDFETAFEEGEFEEFELWRDSSQPGWMLLDSIDEARLQSTTDLDRALRTLNAHLKPALQRCHVVLTGRSAAWRPFSDPELCARRLPYAVPTSQAGLLNSESTAVKVSAGATASNQAFELFSLEDLSRDQVKRYAQACGIEDIEQLFDELDRSAGWAFTTRPLDLQELLGYWQRNRRIGSRRAFLEDSIQRRLQESSQDRAERTPLTPQRAREGARRVAAACTLMRQQTIAVPDGTKHARGLRLDTILSDWSPKEQAALLQLPIFDDEIYGTVRFHHRVVREYLTAEWMAELLRHNASRAAIEGLIFKNRYGLQVINPTTRAVLSWLALRDTRFQQHALQIAPNALLEDGDPSQLPLGTRKSVLRTLCAALAAGTPRIYSDYHAIQRFAGQELTGEVLALLHLYPDEEIQDFLLRMVWQGRLSGALEDVLHIAKSDVTHLSTRIYAIRALLVIGTPRDLCEVREAVALTPGELDRALVAELLEASPYTADTLEWLVRCAPKLPAVGRFSVDCLRGNAHELAQGLDADTSRRAVEMLWQLVQQEPFALTGECDISSQHAWLMDAAARAIRNLIDARHPGAMAPASLELLKHLPQAQQYDLASTDNSNQALRNAVAGWPKLTFALFWHLIEHARAHLNPQQGPIVNFWQARLWDTFVDFGPAYFDCALSEIVSRPLRDDKLVALSLAWNLYCAGEKSVEQAERLRKVCEAQPPEIAQRLETYLNPPPLDASTRRTNRKAAVHKARAKRNAAKRVQAIETSRVYLLDHLEEVRGTNRIGSAPLNAQVWLYRQLRLAREGGSTWDAGNWTVLIPTFGVDIAQAYRDGLQKYWRRNRPELRSEGAQTQTTQMADILGLGGLTIESDEVPGWCANLSPSEVEIAFRHAMHELNGFPAWFLALYHHAPETVRALLLAEVDFELGHSNPEHAPRGVAANLANHGHWLWDALGQDLLARLSAAEHPHDTTCRYLLDVVQGSNVSDEDIAQLAQTRCTLAQPQFPPTDQELPRERAAQWYAVWTGVDPAQAIPALERYLAILESAEDRTAVMMRFLVSLSGTRYDRPARVRKAHVTPRYLQALYLLAITHVRVVDDIDRSSGGVYSPGERDNAQDARDGLLELLRSQTGKETFLVLSDIAHQHPHPAYRAQIQQYARAVAEADSADAPWSEEQVRQFHETQECTPADHRELFELAVRRLEDLKHSLEEGDTSNAPMLALVATEKHIRVYIGDWLNTHASGRYHTAQEEEFADAKRSDIRLLGQGFNAPVPIELKLANNWSGPEMFERLENQLCGDYLRDNRSGCGIFLLVYRGKPQTSWQLPGTRQSVDFSGFVQALQRHWEDFAPRVAHVQDIKVIGIDLTRRTA